MPTVAGGLFLSPGRVQIIRSSAGMQRFTLRHRSSGARIALVPTMGALHAGHLSLVRCARRALGPRGIVVVSIYVNPTQFGPQEDYRRYPRALRRDTAHCRAAGVDVVFAPDDAQMYPSSAALPRATAVVEEFLSRPMEGVARPGHFRGVTTVVAKLFNIVQPHVAVFGAKDYQQARVIQRMVRDLNFPVRIVVAPTVRERDGLAMSSRNQYLTPDERKHATVLWRTIQAARQAAAHGPSPAGPLRRKLRRRAEHTGAVHVEYLEFFDPATLVPVRTVRRGVHVAMAARVGRTRLIDNARL